MKHFFTLILLLLLVASVSAQRNNRFSFLHPDTDVSLLTSNGAGIHASNTTNQCEVCPGNLVEILTNSDNGLIVQHSHVQLFYTWALESPLIGTVSLFGTTHRTIWENGTVGVGNNSWLAGLNAACEPLETSCFPVNMMKVDTSDNIRIGGTYANDVNIFAHNSQVSSFQSDGLHVTGGIWLNGNSVSQTLRDQSQMIAEMRTELSELKAQQCK